MDRKEKTQAAWDASLRRSQDSAKTNAVVEASIKNPTQGTPVAPPLSYVVTPNSMADGKAVRVDDRKPTYGGEIRKF